jgi:hypothetical protein
MLIGSPAGAFAFGINASQVGAQAPGPSQAARPPAELRHSARRWHPAGHQQGQVLRAPGRWYVQGAHLPGECGLLACTQ